MGDALNACCPHNASGCNWGVGYNRPGEPPATHVEHFEAWADAANAWADVAYAGGCTNDLIASKTGAAAPLVLPHLFDRGSG